MIGSRIAHFEITAKLGAGGMGEVYRATDARLDREVAIKVLPERLADDRSSRERFEREARAVSGLNHPHICTLYDVGEHEGVLYLVMELVEGETLATRLARGRLPLEEALRLGGQIASALDKAHRAGIVHRDLKPGNIMVTAEGAKLLDFGLARLGAGSPVGIGTGVGSEESTQAADEPLTTEGAIVGTLQYMAPEQLEGRPADARTDVFAFGAVLHEMLTGRRAFDGSNQASLIGAILHEQPPRVSELQELASPLLDRTVATCLAKSADDRWQSTSDLARQLGWISESADVARPLPAPPARTSSLLPWAVAVVALGAAALAWLSPGSPESPPEPAASVRLSIELPSDAPLAPSGSFFLGVGRPSLAISPDGSRLVYVALVDGERHLYARDMRTGEVLAVPGTRDAQGPFFSPDGERLAFFAENKLKTVRLDGGQPESVANAVWGYGGLWREDGIYFSPTEFQPLSRVHPSGGPVEIVTEALAKWPSLLPRRSELLVTLFGGVRSSLAIVGIGDDAVVTRLRSGDDGRFVPSGPLVYGSEGRMLAAPFDLGSATITGDPVVLFDDVRTETHGSMQAAWSDDGTMVYAPGPDLGRGQLVWLSRDGEREPLGLAAGRFAKFELSPDGRFLAIPIYDGDGRDIWIHEIGRDAPQRLTHDGAAGSPAWDLDGESIYYESWREEGRTIYRAAVGGANQEPTVVLGVEEDSGRPFIDTPDGLFIERFGHVQLLLEESGSGEPRTRGVLDGAFQEGFPALSPDGRWLAYMSDETGHWQIYVVSYPDQGTKRLVSSTGGEEPRWSPDGTEIIYRYGSQWLSVPFSDTPELTLGEPRLLFEGPYINIPGYSWTISRDGERFLLVENTAQSEPLTRLVVITNFFDEVARRAPSGG